MPERSAERPAALDWLVGAAGLLGGTLLLSGRRRRSQAQADQRAVGDELDDTAKAGRGRPRTPPSAAAERLGHEPLDANASAVGRVMAVLAATVILAVFALLGVLALFHGELQAARPSYTGEQSARIEPPKPLLEAHPAVDLHNERAREQATLDGYGWRDAAHTRAHIPIARAMALAVGRSLDAAP